MTRRSGRVVDSREWRVMLPPRSGGMTIPRVDRDRPPESAWLVGEEIVRRGGHGRSALRCRIAPMLSCSCLRERETRDAREGAREITEGETERDRAMRERAMRKK